MHSFFSVSRFLTRWIVKQACLSCAPSAVNQRLLGPNHHVLPVGRVSACPDVLYAAFPSKARRLPLPSRVILLLRNSLFQASPSIAWDVITLAIYLVGGRTRAPLAQLVVHAIAVLWFRFS